MPPSRLEQAFVRCAPTAARRCRRRVDAGAVDLGLHLPGMRAEQQNAVADPDRLGNRVRHEQHRELRVLPELQQLLLHLRARQRVERRERLVHQQDRGLHRHRARDGDALLHAAGQRVRIAVGELASGSPCRCSAARARRASRRASVPLAVSANMMLSRTVFHGSSWSNSWNTNARSGPGPSTRVPFEQDLAFDRPQIAADGLEQRRLAAARRTEDDEAIRAQDVEADAIGRRDEVLACCGTAA